MAPRTVPAVLIAGTHRGCGKTTFATGLMAAWKKRGHTVQPYKIGADALETGYHELAAGRPSIVLDLWIMSPKALETSFAAATDGADILVLDGARGLYDGSDLSVGPVSTWDVSTKIKPPVVLVIDASGMAESAAAVAMGFARFRQARIAGVLLNRVAGPRHYEVLRRAVEKHAELPVFGYLPPDAGLDIPSYQSGLVAAEHLHSGQTLLPALVEKLEQSVDLDRLMEAISFGVEVDAPGPPPEHPNRVRIGVARDAAFHFYYEDNLTLLKAAGAEIVAFSPMRDPALPPDLGGLYLGGGIPESCAAALERNQTMREAIRAAAGAGLPVYAESGGMLYLSTNLVGTGIRAWEMCGLIPGEMRMVSRFPSAAYVGAEAARPTILVRPGERYQGNEFRISAWSGASVQSAAWKLYPPSGGEARPEGFVKDNLHASFVHLHFASAPELPGRFVAAARAYAASKGGVRKKKDFRKAKQRSRER
ncbi:MAG TPA: cobyrinate a,c-diamide synthase [Planctomycetota bacterium]|nr:cobyrinate a,c-diamide synthase [Planctomycetota bacterium]